MTKKLGWKLWMGADTSQYRTQVKKAQGYGNAFKSSIKKIGPAIAAAFSVQAVKSFVQESVRLYDVQAKAEASLLTALKGREDVQQRLMAQASELQKVTLFGDEETIAGMSSLAQVLGNNEQAIKRLMPLVQDLAVAKFQGNLVTAADMVAKSVGSSTNALSRYAIQIEGQVGSVERLESAIRALNEQVGGQAVAAAQAGTGAITQWTNAWGDLKEEIGSFFAPGMTDVARRGTDILQVMMDDNMTAMGKVVWGAMMNTATEDQAKVLLQLRDAQEKLRKRDDLTSLSSRTGNIRGDIRPGLRSMQGMIDRNNAFYDRRASFSPMDMLEGMGADGVFTSKINAGLADMGHLVERNKELYAGLYDEMYRISELNALLETGFEGMIGSLAGGLGELVAGGSLQGFFNSIGESLASFGQQVGSWLIAYGFSMDALKETFKKPGVAIAAGATLIMASKALSSLISSGPDVGGGSSYAGASPGSEDTSSITRNAAVQAQVALNITMKAKGRDLAAVVTGDEKVNGLIAG